MCTSFLRRSKAPGPASLAALFATLSLLPLVAHAEEADLGEVVHAIFIVGIFAVLFLAGLGLGIWLIVQRLRSDEAEKSRSGLHRPNLEAIWFPGSNALPTTTSTPPENP
jgi:hypothetical protein